MERIPYDKNKDNFKAIFSNDVVLTEFERILKNLKNNSDGFNVSDFLQMYNAPDNHLRLEKMFSTKNLKKYIDTYIKEKNLPVVYKQAERKWFIDNPFSIAV